MSSRYRLGRRASAALREWKATLPASVRADLTLRSWRSHPVTLIAVAVDSEQARDAELWTTELIEYINSHEEAGFYLQERRFHICRAHAAARRVIHTGVIPAAFACPRGEPRCPYAGAAALVPDRALRLRVV